MKDIHVLVAGELNPDLILKGPDLEPRFGEQEILVESAELVIGSSSAIFACGAARLGLRIAFVGIVGDDEFGRYMCQSLRATGVDISAVVVDPARHTGLSVILARADDRAILTYSGAIGAMRAEQVPDDLLRRARHLHVASYFLQTSLRPGLANLFQRAHDLGLTTSLDTNWDPLVSWAGLSEVLAATDVFMPNRAEAEAIARASDLETALEELSLHVPVGAVKLGGDGALGWRGTERTGVAAPSVCVVDTVGAGDSFDAGFVYGFINGWELQPCLRLAVTCGALSTRAAGGTAAQPTLAEVQAYMDGQGHDPAG